MQVLEVDIEEDACALAFTYLGVRSCKLKAAGQTGFPDRIFWLRGGKPYLVEFKRPGEIPRPKQLYEHDFLKELEYEVHVFTSPEACLLGLVRALEPQARTQDECEVLARARLRGTVP